MLQRTFILHPKKLDKSHIYTFQFDYEELTFQINEGDFYAIYAKTKKGSKGVILYFHGNADNLERWGHISEEFLSRSYDVIMMDYRGFGKSDGKSSEMNMYKDAQVIYDYALKFYDSKDIVVYGRSIGTGVATNLASSNITKQLILETPFYSIPDIVQKKYPFVLQLFKMKFEFPNYRNIDQLTVPIHIFHGTKDRVVPYKSAERLIEHLEEDDSFLTIEGGGHKNLGDYEAYHSRLDSILDVR